MLADIYPSELRGTALGIYNWGIYMGYSMSYALGNLITAANINDQVTNANTCVCSSFLFFFPHPLSTLKPFFCKPM